SKLVQGCFLTPLPPPPRLPQRLRVGLARVALVAQRLPVALVPEERHVAPVRDNVVNVSRRHKLPLLFALLAPRMKLEEQRARPLPPVVVVRLRPLAEILARPVQPLVQAPELLLIVRDAVPLLLM